MQEHLFTVGICATNDRGSMPRLLGNITAEKLPAGCFISDMVIVVSGSTDGTERIAESFRPAFSRTLIVEDSRRGKAEAVNRIMSCMRGNYLILVNGDALPELGALSRIMESLSTGEYSVACALPVPADSECSRIVGCLTSFLWSLHNSTMERLQQGSENIHLTDEMIGLSAAAVSPLPEGTVNDGAYIAVRAQHYGHKTGFCRDARVTVSVPAGLAGLLRQRRRILYGHMLVKEMTGSAPGTVEFKFKERPVLCAGILFSQLRAEPRNLLLLPLLVSVEMLAMFGALRDRKRRFQMHTIWKRVKNAAWR